MNRLESLSKIGCLESAYASLLSGSGPSHKGHKHFWQRALSRRGFSVQRPVSQAGRVLYLHRVRLMVPHPGRYAVEFNPLALAQKCSTSTSLALEASPQPSPTSMDSSGSRDPGALDSVRTIRAGSDSPATYGADIRFMIGEYIGLEGRHQQGTFAFI